MKNTPRPPQADYNPFDAGVQKAMNVSRATLGMNQEQRAEAFRDAINAFSNSLAQRGPVGPQKGFLNHLAALNVGAVPALQAYNASKKGSMAENQVLAEKIAAAREKAEERAMKARKYDIDEEYKDKKLTIQERTLNEKIRRNKAKESNDPKNRPRLPFGLNYQTEKGAEKNQQAMNAFADTSSKLQLAEDMVKDYELRFGKQTGLTESRGLLGPYINTVTDVTNKLSNPEGTLEYQARENIIPYFKGLNVEIERALEGGGKIAQATQVMLNKANVSPNFEKDTPIVLMDKIKLKKKIIDEALELGKLSEATEINVNHSNYKQVLERHPEYKQHTPNLLNAHTDNHDVKQQQPPTQGQQLQKHDKWLILAPDGIEKQWVSPEEGEEYLKTPGTKRLQ